MRRGAKEGSLAELAGSYLPLQKRKRKGSVWHVENRHFSPPERSIRLAKACEPGIVSVG